MAVFYVVIAMVLVGLIVAALARVIWKTERPIGLVGDMIVSILVAVVVGLVDYYIIPAMGFSETLMLLGLFTEPALGALLALWLVRRARQS